MAIEPSSAAVGCREIDATALLLHDRLRDRWRGLRFTIRRFPNSLCEAIDAGANVTARGGE